MKIRARQIRPEKMQNARDKKQGIFCLIKIRIPAVDISSAYLACAVYRTCSLYNPVKYNERGWTGHVN